MNFLEKYSFVEVPGIETLMATRYTHNLISNCKISQHSKETTMPNTQTWIDLTQHLQVILTEYCYEELLH